MQGKQSLSQRAFALMCAADDEYRHATSPPNATTASISSSDVEMKNPARSPVMPPKIRRHRRSWTKYHTSSSKSAAVPAVIPCGTAYCTMLAAMRYTSACAANTTATAFLSLFSAKRWAKSGIFCARHGHDLGAACRTGGGKADHHERQKLRRFIHLRKAGHSQPVKRQPSTAGQMRPHGNPSKSPAAFPGRQRSTARRRYRIRRPDGCRPTQ